MLSPPTTTTTKAQKHSSFINPLINMNFDVGGIFDNDKDGSDILVHFYPNSIMMNSIIITQKMKP